MKKEWMAALFSLALAGLAALPQERFFAYYRAGLVASDSLQISFLDRVAYAAALANAPSPSMKQKCPAARGVTGHS